MTAPDDDLAAAERRLRVRVDANLNAADKALKQATRTPIAKGAPASRNPIRPFEVAEHCDRTALAICNAIVELRQHRAEEEKARQVPAVLEPFAEVDGLR